MTIARLSVLSASLLSTLAGEALSQTDQFKTPHVIDDAGPIVSYLNGTTFVNLGMVGVGRIPAFIDAQGSTFGSASALAITPGSWSFDPATRAFSGQFLTLPDRGRNDPANGVFMNYQTRIQRLDFTFRPLAEGDGSAQDQLVFDYKGLTLLSESNALPTVGNDPGAEFGEAFGRIVPRNSGNITIDAESLVCLPDGSSYIGDEYGSAIYRFNAEGMLTGVITPPEALVPRNGDGVTNFSSAFTPATGRRPNQGTEGLAITPDGNFLIAFNQSAAMQDSAGNQTNRRHTRVLVYDIAEDPTPAAPVAHYVLELPTFRSNGDGGAVDRTAAQSDAIAIGTTQFLFLPRDGNGRGVQNGIAPVYKTVMLADLSGATNIVDTDFNGPKAVAPGGVLDLSVTPVARVEAINLLNLHDLGRFGLNIDISKDAPNGDMNTLSEKWEGLALAPDLSTEDPNDYFLFVANDNDFLSTDGTMLTTEGEEIKYSDPFDNDTLFLAYRVRIVQGCYADFTRDGELDLFDFLEYVNAFNAANPAADCDASGSLDLFDFLCFTNAFNAGC